MSASRQQLRTQHQNGLEHLSGSWAALWNSDGMAPSSGATNPNRHKASVRKCGPAVASTWCWSRSIANAKRMRNQPRSTADTNSRTTAKMRSSNHSLKNGSMSVWSPWWLWSSLADSVVHDFGIKSASALILRIWSAGVKTRFSSGRRLRRARNTTAMFCERAPSAMPPSVTLLAHSESTHRNSASEPVTKAAYLASAPTTLAGNMRS
eukprot:Amastigsp_a339910_56.p3 type:complete len:208 gc:universal Amastigsp_a339910_56:1015-392(-)